MKVLGIDTALGACSVAIWDGVVIASDHKIMARGHVEKLIPMAEAVIAQSPVEFDDLDLISVSIGPGSFTGIRAGLAAAKGFGLGLNIPVHGVTTLEAVAYAACKARSSAAPLPIVVALETKRSDFYVQRFDQSGLAINRPAIGLTEEIVSELRKEEVCLCGDGAPRVLASFDELQSSLIENLEQVQQPSAGDIAEIAANRYDNPISAEPLYIHPPAAKLPQSKGKLRP
ncbi:MAG: tRNA (adenosine(37)-N6)-threonylcarbamoyltransferase complex dimerization subunit type 1 TsaB [Rhodospirillaceae bacterium]|nr:tRNA (adenosine(37)-N6)-threonylcarbamoyltransferase complex dimerization subunit type 1 TsaB [Rhodospirillaceae bacterium]|tara:strand:+ start:27291 stop:27977 length:687 start_codon:yes stop_codon:yes gene_type:complete